MFDDIRPYHDSEVRSVVRSLINEQEFIDAIATFSLPKLFAMLPTLSRYIVKFKIKQKARKLTSIEDIQLYVSKFLNSLVKSTITSLTYSGLENIPKNRPCLFISNHRDIVLDVALINYVLHENGLSTVEAAVGDNLLSKKWVADLMRINKSFVVKRNEKTKRAMLNASKQLSAYILHSLTTKQQNIWIAQKEGRAKDGIDKTNAALISMLLLNKPKEQTIAEYLNQLNIVPVSISYEFDPCDKIKAKELAKMESTGRYEKEEHEDLKSITQGIIGQKGNVHLAFGKTIEGEYSDSKAISNAIDQQIIGNYKLFQSNQSANEYLESGELKALDILAPRFSELSEHQKALLIKMYANPVIAKQSLL
ncbi:1-acyl-sn-glycerol-3-phosphate acyltransferase [Thalassotalea sediminis]|uniref:1-acyl-sn-glycerol-3-phosphate acyltransferase n=1 Tax=Thalassotalea sediminis TaxID=1759089 RepID=UPI002573519C|nr:1-acyl-sn-glycerol-3-phosphate acyltransferase [Thalassotalea sediminis]